MSSKSARAVEPLTVATCSAGRRAPRGTEHGACSCAQLNVLCVDVGLRASTPPTQPAPGCRWRGKRSYGRKPTPMHLSAACRTSPAIVPVVVSFAYALVAGRTPNAAQHVRPAYFARALFHLR